MINDFKNQTPETIFHFLSLLGREADVYSTKADDLCPTLANDNAYIYIKDHELVIVLVDKVMKSTREIAELEFSDPDEESKFQDVSTPEIAHNDFCRTSPAWKLFQAARSMRDLTNPILAEPLEAYGVLITCTDIINYEELDIAAFCGHEDISMTIMHRCFTFYDHWQADRLPVNTAPSLPGAEYLHIYERELSKAEIEKEQQEFMDMLNSFLGNDSDDKVEDDDDTVDAGNTDDTGSTDDDFDFDIYGFDDDGDDDDDPPKAEPAYDANDLDSRIAACQSAEERRRLIVLRAKLAVRDDT